MKLAKRAFDLFWAGTGLLLLWPVFLVLAAAIRLDDGGPALFRQERVGHRGVPFRIWKFRTMRRDAEKEGALTVGEDDRITRVGALLRRTKLDELPQLVNVARGEMSLVGPRPEVPRYVGHYTEAQRRVLGLVPGITDPASTAYRDESAELGESEDPERLYVETILPAKIRLNLEYAAGASVWTDTVQILKTLGSLYASPGHDSHTASLRPE